MPRSSGRASLTTVAIVSATMLALAIVAWLAVRNALQYRATYNGGLTFVGSADGVDVRYVRLFVWKPPGYADPLPHMSLYIDGTPYPVDTLTPDTFQKLGGTRDEGGLWDTAGNVLQYRFENDRLTWLSIVPTSRAPEPVPTPNLRTNIRTGAFQISVNGGAPFTLPVSGQQLRETSGPPTSVTRNIAN
ncbi:MAG: hypothetical protein HUU46_22345 [Candidatus Hydrogenedentes bacterium]|nr:hypothetical protein [Candidatus Hydrogenedentota bacterium]